jgi:hypothetical protein
MRLERFLRDAFTRAGINDVGKLRAAVVARRLYQRGSSGGAAEPLRRPRCHRALELELCELEPMSGFEPETC